MTEKEGIRGVEDGGRSRGVEEGGGGGGGGEERGTLKSNSFMSAMPML